MVTKNHELVECCFSRAQDRRKVDRGAPWVETLKVHFGVVLSAVLVHGGVLGVVLVHGVVLGAVLVHGGVLGVVRGR